MSRAISTALTADFSGFWVRLFGLSDMTAPTLTFMTNADDRSRKTERLGRVVRRIAARLATNSIKDSTPPLATSDHGKRGGVDPEFSGKDRAGSLVGKDRREPRMEGAGPIPATGASNGVGGHGTVLVQGGEKPKGPSTHVCGDLDKIGRTFGKEPERAARCPAPPSRSAEGKSARLAQGRIDQPRYAAGAWGASVGSVSNVIQFAPCLGHGAREPSRTLRPAHCSAPDLSAANSVPSTIATARGSAYQGAHSGYWRRTDCLLRACTTVV
jgi:hypothetical protein